MKFVVHVLRGGSYNRVARGLRVAYRIRSKPEDGDWLSGFRLVIRKKK